MSIESNIENKWFFFCIFALFTVLIFSAIRDYFFLASHNVPVGVDGYYYVIQVESLIRQWELYYPTNFPVVLYLITFAAKIFSDAVLAVKITGIFLHAFLSLGLFALIASITSNKWLGVLAATVSTVSVIHFYWISEFINHLGGVAFGLWGTVCLIYALRNKLWWIPTVIAFVIAFFCHKSIALICLTVLLIFLVWHILEKVRFSRFYLLIISVVIIFCLCLPWILSKQTLFQLPKEMTETIFAVPRIPIDFTNFEEKLVLLVLAPLGLYFFYKLHTESAKQIRYLIGAVSLFSIFFTLNPFLNHEEGIIKISQRLDLLAYLQISILLPCFYYLFENRMTFAVVTGSTIALLILGNNSLPMGMEPRFLKEREFLAEKLIKVRQQLPENSLIIAPHGYQFLVTHTTRILSQRALLSDNNSPKNLFWLLFRVPCNAANKEVISVYQEGSTCIFLLRQGQQLTVTDYEKEQILRMNPHLRRNPTEIINQI